MSSLEYIIKANLILLSWVLVYRLFLRGFSDFVLSRAYLLIALPFALIFPLIRIPSAGVLNESMNIAYLKTVEIVAENNDLARTSDIFPYLALIIVALGCLILLPQYVFAFVKLRRLRRRSVFYVSDDKIRICRAYKDISPFSFLNTVYLPHCEMPDAVLIHEKAHIKYKHSFDIVLLSIFKFFFWINPTIWYISRELRSIHEYQADSAVLSFGIDKISYLQLLLSLSLNNFTGVPVNSFNQSLTKKRIIMMKQIKSERAGVLKVVSAIAVLAVSTYFISCSNDAKKDNAELKKDSAKTEVAAQNTGQPVVSETEDKALDMVEEMPRFGTKEADLSVYLSKNIKYPESARKSGVEGTVYINFVVGSDGIVRDAKVLKSASPELDKEALRVVQSMPAWSPGLQKGKPVSVSMNLPVKFKLS